MKLYVLSDLHLEFAHFDPPELAPDVDLVVLAGDIHKLDKGVKWANEAFSQDVLYVLGNHEFYSGHFDRTIQKARAAAASHVHVLENESYVAGEIRFLCTTSWTDFTATGDYRAAMRECAEGMNDFKVIRAGDSYSKLRPADVIGRNIAARQFLAAELANGFDGRTVVVTHHCPLRQVAGEGHPGHLGAAYFNQWDDLVSQADAWIFGHTHRHVDVQVSGCRIISNPRGYPGERTGFVPGFVVDI